MDLALIVVSYNTRDLTRGCLTSAYAALERAALKGAVWVVDNASTDGSAEMIRASFPEARLLESGENLGFGRGANLALEAIAASSAPPRHVMILNPDTVVEPDALGRLVRTLDECPEAGVVGPRLSYADGSFQHSAFRFPTLAMLLLEFWPLNHRLANSRLNGRYPRRLYEAGRPFPIDHPLGAAFVVRWEAARQVGFFDPAFFMYCEEVEWCLRLKRAGWGIYCEPRARIIHLEGRATHQFREAMLVELWRSRFILFGKHYPPPYRWLARRIARAGLAREIRRARSLAADGQLAEEEAAVRVRAYLRAMEV